MDSRKLIIAIDGFSSCGKSTLAKQLAKVLGYKYIDSGAMYRGIALYLVQNNIDLNDHNAISEALDHIDLAFSTVHGNNDLILNDVNVEKEIRTPQIAQLVSPIATISEVREKAVALQQKMGAEGGIVMDGRDIGTTVFPNADLKIFMTAEIQIRSMRRYSEMLEKGTPQSLTEVEANLIQRDHIDSTRAISPLRKAENAVVLDNSTLTMEEQLNVALDWVNEIINTESL